MALAAVAYAKAMRRRQVMVATSSIGPGALEHGHRRRGGDGQPPAGAAAVRRHVPEPAARSRAPAGRARRATRRRRSTTRSARSCATGTGSPGPSRSIQSLPQAVAAMLDPADCGPAFLALPQDVQAEAFDFPARLFDRVVHTVPGPAPTAAEVAAAVAALRGASAPLIIAGGGVHYSLAEAELADVRRAPRHAGRRDRGRQVEPWRATTRATPARSGSTGCEAANRLAADADVVLAVGTRLQDFTTGIVDGVPPPRRADHRRQRRPLRRRQAPRPPGRRRRPGVAGRARRRARSVGGAPERWTARGPSEVAGYWALHRAVSPPSRRRRGGDCRRTPRSSVQ